MKAARPINTTLPNRVLPRSSITWFLIAYVVTVLPQFFIYLPLWIIPIFAACFFWRIQIYRTRFSYPNGLIKTFVVFLLLAGMYLSYGNFFNTLGCSILLMALYSLKFIEAKTVRDGWVLSLLGYFAIAIIYLYNNNLFLALYSLIPVIAVTCGLLGLQQSDYRPYANNVMILSVIKLLLLSIPLMVTLFIVFPRLPSFFSFSDQSKEQINKTGFSDSMSPGDVSKLVQDNKHMFWGEFSESVPKKSALYWRVLTLDQYDGRAWTKAKIIGSREEAPFPRYQRRDKGQNYYVLYEPTNQHYLATLDISELTSFYSSEYLFFDDFHIESKLPITNKIRYDFRFYADTIKELELSRYKNQAMTALPEMSNPKIRNWVADQLKMTPNPIDFSNAVLKYFNQNAFYYTLEPPSLGVNSVDDFFFTTRRGFCEHYASTMTFMLRAANIPARVVVGYLGGEVNAQSKRVQVRGMDAHAWVEYWVKGEGWIRVDPTGAVAPSRIEEGISSIFNESNNPFFGMNAGFVGSFTFKLTQVKELLEYQWTKFILGYQGDVQKNVLGKLLDNLSWKNLLSITFSLIALVFSIQMLFLLKPWRQLYFDASTMFNECRKQLFTQRGIVTTEGVSPRELLKLSENALFDNEYQLLSELMILLEQKLFKPDEDKTDTKKAMKRAFSRFKKALHKKRIQ